MEDAATAEISRANIWQWIHHGVTLDDGQTFTKSLFHSWLYQEIDTIKHEVGDSRYTAGRFEETADLFYQLSTAEEFAAFLTLPSYIITRVQLGLLYRAEPVNDIHKQE